MRFDKLTIKAQETLQDAQKVAESYQSQTIEPEHLLIAMLEASDSTTASLLSKLGVSTGHILGSAKEAAEVGAKVSGISTLGSSLGNRTQTIFDQAFKDADSLNDSYISTEHILLGLIEDKGKAGSILRSSSVSRASVLQAMKELRAGKTVSDPQDESN